MRALILEMPQIDFPYAAILHCHLFTSNIGGWQKYCYMLPALWKWHPVHMAI